MGVRKMVGVEEGRTDGDRSGRINYAESVVYKQESPRDPDVSRAEIAGYIAQMSTELKQMAGAARLDILAYLLSLAAEEANAATRQKGRQNA
jgi:hypothetical protein